MITASYTEDNHTAGSIAHCPQPKIRTVCISLLCIFRHADGQILLTNELMNNYSAAYWPILILCIWAASSFTTILCVLGTISWGRKSTCHGVSQSHTTHASIEKFTNENLYLSNQIKKCKVCRHCFFTVKQTWTVYDQAWALFTLVKVSAKTNSLGKVTVVYV